MFVRVLRIQIKVDKIDKAAELFKKGVIPLCKKQAGFKGAYFMTDPKTGEGVVLTLWEHEKAMLANEESRFFQEQVAKFVDFYTKPPIRETYEVALTEGMKKPQKSKV
jgi:heme-degrading monooxygenase HmoA